ncbi:DUF503 family protein [bacterium]|nr:DUF503 family protein [bacterium]MBU1675386.1 DUF503 family protein [bacterium]
MEDIRAYTGTLVLDLSLPHAASLKDRRKSLRSLIDRLLQMDFAVAQIGPADLAQRAFVAVSAVTGNASRLDERLDEAERIVFQSEFDVRVRYRDTASWSDSSRS